MRLRFKNRSTGQPYYRIERLWYLPWLHICYKTGGGIDYVGDANLVRQ